jgi:hypothetical protein
MDVNLVEALLQLAPGNPLLEAVREFNSTNSDSADVAPHVELVMCHTALEWLTGLWTSKGIIDALNGWFPKDRGWVGNGPMKESWLHRWTPKDDRLLTAWARDFCALRGVSAHANQGARNLWSHFSHLAFVSLLLPAVAKIVLEKHSLYQRTQQDMEEAAAIENYLLFDPQIPVRVGKQSPWSQVRSMTALRRISGGLRSR